MKETQGRQPSDDQGAAKELHALHFLIEVS